MILGGHGEEVMAVAYYHLCTRCRCAMDVGEGIAYPGEGRVCEDCARELDMEAACRKRLALTKARMEKDDPGFKVKVEGIT